MTAFLAEFTKETKEPFCLVCLVPTVLEKYILMLPQMSRLQKYQVWRSYSKQLFYRI